MRSSSSMSKVILSIIFVIAATFFTSAANAAAPQTAYPYGFADVSVANIIPTIVPVDAEGGYYVWREYADLTFAVGNKSPNKQVGIRWSNDSWATFQEAYASYAATDINNGFERWTLHLELGYHDNTQPFFEVQLAAFVSYNNGPRSWDPNNNYFVNQKVDLANPLFLITNGVSYDAASGNILFSGLLRAYPYNRNTDFNPNVINIHWSTDNWKTIQDSPATLTQASNYTWAWSFPVGSKTSIPQNVTYVFKYDSSAGQKWLNNNGQNYLFKILPEVTLSDGYGFLPPANPIKTFNGIASVSAYTNSDVALGLATYTLDGKPVTGNSVFLNSSALKDGTHTLTVKVPFFNTSVIAKTVTSTFTVKNSVQFLNEWIPSKPDASFANQFSAWGVQYVNGKVYVGFDQLIGARYASFGTTAAPEVVYKIPTTLGASDGYVLRIAVDDATGNVYLLTNQGNLYKFAANGTFDSTFGTSGYQRLVLNANNVYGSKPFCFAWDAKVVKSHLIVGDSCNNRIVSFNPATGAFVAEANLTSPGQFYTDSQYLYIAQEIYQQSSSILKYDAATLAPVAAPVVLTPINSNNVGNLGISGFAITADKIYAALDFSNLVRIVNAKTGATIGDWYAGVFTATPVAGAFDVPQSVVVLPDGTFAVLSVGWSGLERFSQTVL